MRGPIFFVFATPRCASRGSTSVRKTLLATCCRPICGTTYPPGRCSLACDSLRSGGEHGREASLPADCCRCCRCPTDARGGGSWGACFDERSASSCTPSCCLGGCSRAVRSSSRNASACGGAAHRVSARTFHATSPAGRGAHAQARCTHARNPSSCRGLLLAALSDADNNMEFIFRPPWPAYAQPGHNGLLAPSAT